MEQCQNHIMLDIETLGNKSNSVICSIAAVEFDITTGTTGKEFYKTISIKSCLHAGLKIDADTLKWWMVQSDAARNEVIKGDLPLAAVLFEFDKFILFTANHDSQIWGNGVRFDLGILENAYHALSYSIPWKHWNERDVRTLVSFAPDIKKNTPFIGTAHNALADCYHQIKYCSLIYKSLFK